MNMPETGKHWERLGRDWKTLGKDWESTGNDREKTEAMPRHYWESTVH